MNLRTLDEARRAHRRTQLDLPFTAQTLSFDARVMPVVDEKTRAGLTLMLLDVPTEAPRQKAKKAGFDQVLWLDGASHDFIEEVGMMNLFVLSGDTLVTAQRGTKPDKHGRKVPVLKSLLRRLTT